MGKTKFRGLRGLWGNRVQDFQSSLSQNKIVSNQQLVLYSSGTLGAAEDEESPQANLTQEEEEEEEEEEDAQAFAVCIKLFPLHT